MKFFFFFFVYNFLVFEKCFLVRQLRWNLRDDLVTANWAYRKCSFENTVCERHLWDVLE